MLREPVLSPLTRSLLLLTLAAGPWLVLRAGPSTELVAPVQDGSGAAVAALPQADVAALRRDVVWLADESRGGRRAGEPGERAAGDWIAARFGELGLEPAGTDGWFHAVEVPMVPEDLGTSTLVLRREGAPPRSASAGELAPLSCAAAGNATGALVFAGYGLDAPHLGWNDYEGLDVTRKIVLVARGAPKGPADAPIDFAGADGLLRKVLAAKRRGALAVLVAQSPALADEALPTFLSGPTSLATLPALFVGVELAEALQPGYTAALAGIDAVAASGGGRAQTTPPATPAGTVELVVAVKRERGTARNVLGLLRGKDKSLPLVVVGAHYDHLGHGHTGSLSPREIGRVHPGADDNASGTAAVLEAARLLKAEGSAGDVLFALWSGEELGLLGSKRWVAENQAVLARTALSLNLDMVGRVREGKLSVLAAGSSPRFAEVLPGMGAERGLTLALEASGRAVGGSDHQSFLEKRIPSLHLFSGLHGDYHRPSDTSDKVEYEGLAQVAGWTRDLVHFGHSAGELPFAEVVASAEPGRARGEGWRVWFGSVPDYTDEGPGLLISGTSPGSPAERAGLLAGDRIVKVGDIEIEGMADFMGMLSAHKPGETLPVVFVRDGERLEVLLTLATRESN
ncbi:MAG: M20/M25/M40 family metallo-hydrolase [Planctomycetaceae bacterium]|nr:M20/M25/M40 family metallo-hydrolase [Planctomycetaceae bacterium]